MAGDDEQKVIEHSSAAAAPWENPNHPLYMHHSDQPGMILVPQALTEDNYIDWSDSMAMALTVKNKHGFLLRQVLIFLSSLVILKNIDA
ncbi:hypothetical protein ACLB2K_067782 [Fragaria x ananassa]